METVARAIERMLSLVSMLRRWYVEFHYVKHYMLLGACYSKREYSVLLLYSDIYPFEKGYLCLEDSMYHEFKFKFQSSTDQFSEHYKDIVGTSI